MRLSTISQELTICRNRNGIKLVRPESDSHSSHSHHKTRLTVADLLRLPMNIYFLNAQSEMHTINQATANRMGFISACDAVGKSMRHISPRANAIQMIQTDREVMETHSLKISEDTVIFKDESRKEFLTFKAPWFDDEDKILGVFGCSIHLGDQSLAQSLTQVFQLGLFDNPANALTAEICLKQSLDTTNNLTPREKEIVYHSVRGRTASEISKILFISGRTVEQHLNNVKEKFGVRTKSELIQKILDHPCA